LAIDRELLRGSLELLVLSFVSGRECYGYEILAALREQSGGRVDLKAGTLYPILHKLEHEGNVTSRWEETGGRDRKWYSITQAGRLRLKSGARDWLDYAACVRAVLEPALRA
jgi:PadR family transcriptional regulator, regulatory protein PadR